MPMMLSYLVYCYSQRNFIGHAIWKLEYSEADDNLCDLSHLTTRFQNLGEMMTLGRNDAAISPSFIEGLTLEGPIGHTGKFLFLAPFCCPFSPLFFP